MDLERRRGESPIRSIFCCNDCIRPGNQSSNFELGQIYLGDHLTRSWNRPIKSPPICTSPVSGQLPAPLKGSKTIIKETSIRRSSRRRKIKSAKEILNLFTITIADFQLWSTSFDALLKSEAGLQIFRNFLETEFAEENLKFWLACENLKSTTRHSKKMERRIQDIFDTYISTHSASEVNIDYKMRENIVDQLKSNDADIFTGAQHQIYSLMYRDSYPRFLSSAIVTDLMEEVNALKQPNSSSKIVKQRRDAPYFSCCVKRQEHDSMRDSHTPYRNDVVEVRIKPCGVNDGTNKSEELDPRFSITQSPENDDSSGEKFPSEQPPSTRQSPFLSKKLNGDVKVSSSSKDKLISSRQASALCDASFSN